MSLTSIAPRIKMTPLCIRMLLSQSFRPDKLILWLSEYDVNGNKVISEDRLPKELLMLKKFGLEIRFCKDLGPHGKLIHALKEFPDAVIVTADDDVVYPKDWLEKLYGSYKDDPEVIHCCQARLISFDQNSEIDKYLDWILDFSGIEKSFLVFPLGVDGVLYPPNVLDDEVFNERVFSDICPKADDIWFKAMALLNKTYCKRICKEFKAFPLIPGSQIVSLFSENMSQNDVQIKAVFERYYLLEKFFNAEC